jgi:copper oxidase (laccase) domain-containing protein
MKFLVALDPAEEGGFNVSVPAFDGCFTQGENEEEALKNAKEAPNWIKYGNRLIYLHQYHGKANIVRTEFHHLKRIDILILFYEYFAIIDIFPFHNS